ncbi:hypothetical protein ACFL4W_05705 [Planctomycetota bacterium]
MKKYLVLFVLVMIGSYACANPVIDSKTVSKGLLRVVFSVLIIQFLEVFIVAGVLLAFRVFSPQLLVILYAMNVLFYALVFYPLIIYTEWVVVSEIVIVCIECLVIKGVSYVGPFQRENFSGLKWRYALLVSFAGNLSSFLLGFTPLMLLS